MYLPKKLKLTNFISHKDSEYEFRNGVAILVVGDNRDNASQAGNGAGKSGLIEAIPVALTGDCIRAASMKELVGRHWGSDIAVVDLTLTNSMYRCELRIRRTISNSKPQIVELWENDNLLVYSDVNEYNRQILQLLSISKDDLFNFYIITKEYYKPFLTIGDTVKKEIINRFSGANSIDGVFPLIEKDIETEETGLKEVETKIANIKGKQELLAEQIKQEEDKYSTEYIAQQRIELQDAINTTEDEITGSDVLVEDYQKNIEAHNIRIIEVSKENDEFLVAINKDLAVIQSNENNIKAKQKEIDLIAKADEVERKNIEREIAIIDKELNENRANGQEAIEIIETLQNQLAGVIECPKCEHEFSLQHKDFNPGEARESMTSAQELHIWTNQEIIKLNQEKEKKSKELIALQKLTFDKQAKIRTAVNDINFTNTQLQDSIKKWRVLKNKAEQSIGELNSSIKRAEREIEHIKKEKVSLIESMETLIKKLEYLEIQKSDELDSLNELLLEYVDKEADACESRQLLVDKIQRLEEWKNHFKDFKSFLANQSIKNIQDYTNMYLQMMGTDLSIEIEGYKVMSNKKLKEQINTRVLRNGFDEGSYGTFSAGERGRIDVCVILAMQALINLNCSSGGLDLMLADEIFDSIDPLGIECIINGLQNIKRTVMIVSQVQINSLNEYTLTIKKENKISTICLQSMLELTQEKMEQLQQSIPKQEVSKKQSSLSSEKVKGQKLTKKQSRTIS